MKKVLTCCCLLAVAAENYGAALEEVVVTAQHRTESLGDVPVSVSAVSGDKMFEAGIGKMEDLQAYVPNLTINEAGLGTSIYIRGIGSGENQGFEQSVGTYVDGVYYGRAQLARAPFLDLAQIEVLRGPQNILYGKNSIGGAIAVRTANPTQDFEGLVSVGYEPRFNEQTGDLVLSGPINDTMGLRFAARARRSDGYIENQITNTSEPQREEFTLRLKGLWDIRDDLTGTFKIEHGQFNVNGRQSEVITDLPSNSDVVIFNGRTYGEIVSDTNVGVDLGNNILLPNNQTTFGIVLDEHPSVLDNEADFKSSRQKDFSDNETYALVAQFDLAKDDNTYTFITGYLQYGYDEECDCDYSGADLFRLQLNEDYKQFSQEFRWLSPVGETWEFIGGGYFQYSELRFFDSILVESDLITQVVNAADTLEGGARGDVDPQPSPDPRESSGTGDAGNALAGIRSPRPFASDSLVSSVFLQGTWNFREDLRFTFGGRLTYENKTGERRLDFAFPDGTIQPIGEVDTAAAVSFAAERHDLSGERTETQFSPLLKMQYYPSDEAMLYATLSRGFKAGGYDARSNASPSPELTPLNPNVAGCTEGNPADGCNQVSLVGSFEYEPEQADSFEFGGKMSLLDGAAELNFAVFYTLFDDLQVSVFDGTLGFNVGNAASAVSQGIEFDGRIALSENWLLAGGLSLLSFEYDDHESGTCVQGQEPNVPGTPNCDYSGKDGQNVADFSGNLLLSYNKLVSDNWEFRGNLDVLFTDDYNPSPNLDSRVEQPAYEQYNGRLAMTSIDGQWDIALVGKNLTDKTIFVYTQDLPTAHTITQATTHFAFIAPRRTISLQMS